MNFKTSNLPPILELAERIRNGETPNEICEQYSVSRNTLQIRFNQAGFSLTTGRALNTVERDPLPGGHQGAGGTYIGGGDWNRGLPTQPRPTTSKPKPKGIDWDEVRAHYEANGGVVDDSIWGNTSKVKMNRRGNTFTESDTDPEALPAEHYDVPVIEKATQQPVELTEAPEPEPAPAPPAPAARPGRPGRTFTDEQRADITRRYKVGESVYSIATSYGVQAPSVRRILEHAGIEIRTRAQAAALRHHPELAETLEQREGDQPLPVINDHTDIQSMVIADIEARRQVGISRYGTALQPFNGRDALQDLYEELIDAAMYIKQVMVERAEQNQPAV